MDRAEIINAIIEADKTARAEPLSAKAELASLDETLAAERAKLREEYFGRAEKRIESVRVAESSYATEQIRMLDARLTLDIRSSREAAERHRERWIDELFRSVITAPLSD